VREIFAYSRVAPGRPRFGFHGLGRVQRPDLMLPTPVAAAAPLSGPALSINPWRADDPRVLDDNPPADSLLRRGLPYLFVAAVIAMCVVVVVQRAGPRPVLWWAEVHIGYHPTANVDAEAGCGSIAASTWGAQWVGRTAVPQTPEDPTRLTGVLRLVSPDHATLTLGSSEVDHLGRMPRHAKFTFACAPTTR
jgi:hypothetical protein